MSQQSNPFIHDDGQKCTCMEMLQLVLDGQATPEQKNYFTDHMDGCMPCYKSYEVEAAIKEMIKSKCCSEQVPAELVDRIKSKLNLNI